MARRLMRTLETARRRFVGGCLAALLVTAGAVAKAQDDPGPQGAFRDEVTVSELSVVLRVVDSHGAPVLGLTAEELEVRVGGEVVPVADLRWYSSDSSTSPSEDDEVPRTASTPEATEPPADGRSGDSDPAAPREPPEPPGPDDREDGKLVVLFVQMGHQDVVTLDESWVGGYMKILPSLRRLVRDLPPRDRVAVVSFDSRLKLRLDFTQDREATAERLGDAIGFGDADAERSDDGPSLLDSWDAPAAAATSSPEEGLRVLGEALEPLPGAKDVVFVGWGLGRFTAGFVTMPPAYDEAVRSLARARATVHGLNVVQAEGNALSVGIRSLARTTGGTYAKTFDFGRNRVERLGRVLTGHYLLTLDPADFPGVSGRLRVTLRERIEGRDVRIHHRELRLAGR